MKRRQTSETARAWVGQMAPPDMAASLDDALDDWEGGTLPPSALWRYLGRRFAAVGLLDPAREAGRRAVAEAPDQSGLRAELARLELAAGADAAARDLAETIPATDAAYGEALLVLGVLAPEADPDLAAEITAFLLARPHWSDQHEQGLALLRDWSGPEAAAGLVVDWLKAHGLAPAPIMQMARLLLESGAHQQACPILANLWRSNADELAPLIGPAAAAFPDDPAAGAELCRRVQDALALPEAGLAVHPLPDASQDLPERVLYVGPALTGVGPSFPNDLAEHLGNAAAAAGRAMTTYCDRAITGPTRMRLSDAERARRIDALAGHIRAQRPQVMILDCGWSPLRGDLDPPTLARLKAETGLRLLCLFRDAQTPSLSLIRHWAAAADGLVLFDPLSPVFDGANPDLAAKALVIPVPARPLPPPPEPPHHGLIFIGGLGQSHRPILIGGLLDAGIGVTAILGDRRLRLAPDLDAYAALLADSRAVLNIAVHHQDQRLVTGRVWETIAAGGLLLEQDGSGTPAFFTPYRHYLPWSDITGIVTACHMLERRPDLRRAMIVAARDWSARHYGPDRVWRALMVLAGPT